MYIDDVSPLLRCVECNKPFDKLSTLKRHGYYCRSKKSKTTATRIRSCIICAKIKQRCDQRKPECSRCAFKNLNCSYPADESRFGSSAHLNKDRETLSDLEIRSESSTSVLSSETASIAETVSQHNDALTDTILVDSNQGLNAVEFDPLNLELFQNDPIFSEILMDQPSKDIMLDLPPSLAMPTYLDIPSTPSSLVRQITRRPASTIGSQRAASLILSTLKSYPLMLINTNRPPPFIHYSSLFPDSELDISESLTNCLSLMQMLKGENGSEPGSRPHVSIQPNRKLFWKNIRWECERFCNEVGTLSPQEILSALQALSLYLLVRLSEGETDYNNYDHLLIKTVTMLSQQFALVTSSSCDERIDSRPAIESCSAKDDHSCACSSKQSWKSFVLMESLRRLCLIYQIVNLLVHFPPAALCELPTNVALAPLPSRKGLWAASSEHDFNKEARRGNGSRREETLMFGMTATGGLVKMTARNVDNSYDMYGGFTESNRLQMRDAIWEEYCEGMDELGGLVLLASSLLG